MFWVNQSLNLTGNLTRRPYRLFFFFFFAICFFLVWFFFGLHGCQELGWLILRWCFYVGWFYSVNWYFLLVFVQLQFQCFFFQISPILKMALCLVDLMDFFFVAFTKKTYGLFFNFLKTNIFLLLWAAVGIGLTWLNWLIVGVLPPTLFDLPERYLAL